MTPLAAGGMARIYIARTTGIGSFERHVVLKLITPERANDHTAVQMFLDEARLAASLNHQNVAQVFEVGEDAGIHYLAMEYVHGQDLRALLAKAGSQGTRVPLELALTVVAGAAAGLHHAHERRDPQGVSLGIVHRDVSPSNIMVGYDGAVKLLDFGIAKATSRSVETQSGIIKGKFAYMAPEQCRGRDVDRRSDVFSLGIILYEISTQHRCFRADSDFDTMHRIVTGDVVRPTRLIQGYPQALEAIVMKALAVDPQQRYQSAHQLLEAIEAFAVSSRMSLSTMALGRFMRETFGELPEPWLQQNRGSNPVVPAKEGTISNTNGSSERSINRAPTNLPVANDQPAATLLDLPRGGDDPHDEPNAVEWNAKSYPTMQPAYASAQTIQPDAPQRSSAAALTVPMATSPVAPIAVPHGTGPILPVGQFPSKPGSGSGPSHNAMPSTRHGYASATHTNDLSYPRYEAPAAAEAPVQLKPNRRPIFIGLAIIVVGAAVIIAMMIGKSGRSVKATVPQVAPETSPGGSDQQAVAPDPTPQVAVAPDAAPAPVDPPKDQAPVDESSITIKITSEPAGADVLLFGKVIGTTPLDRKIEKGTGQAILVVHRGGYVDVETKIDLTGDFEKTVQLEKLDEPPPEEQIKKDPIKKKDPKQIKKDRAADVKEVKKDRAADVKEVKKDRAADVKEVKKDRAADVKEVKKDPPKEKDPPVEVKKDPPKEAPKAGCQPQGQQDPFNDSRPVCK
jgi:eukaryotic-like serine/threonine-protein kinase